MSSLFPYLCPRIGDAFNKYQEGIRLNSGAVPAAVSSDDFLQLTPLNDFIGWEGRKK